MLVREHLPAFLDRLETQAQTLEAFTTCGDFEQGFLLLACGRCGDRLRVPFSCKGRGVCPCGRSAESGCSQTRPSATE